MQNAANCTDSDPGKACVFRASVGSSLLFDSQTDSSLYAQSDYEYLSASFIKSAGDVLAFSIQNDPDDYYLDDISITCTVTTA